MTVYPMAILKFCWSDAPFAGEGPSERNIDDNVVNRLFLPLSPWWSVAGYWQGTSFGTIQMEANEVFPWRRLEGFPKPTTANQYDRRQVIPKAVEQALAEGWPLDRFKGIVVWMPLGGAPSQDGGGVDVNGWPACLLHEGDDLESLAHEFGHAFGLEHAWGLSSDGKGLAPYRSPYCVMASQAYGGRRPSFAAPAEPQGPPAGDGFWTRFPPMPAAATLYNQVPDFAALPHVVQAGQVEPLWSRTVRLHARDRSVGPVLAVARAGSGTLGGRQAYLVELRRGQGYDRRIGAGSGAPSAGLVVHSLKDIDEYQDAPEHDRKVVYEGTLGLPVASGDVDWRSKDGDFALRVGDVAPDLSWADVTLGGAALARDAAVALTGETAGGSSELIEEGIAENVSVFVCGKGSYRFTIDRQDAVVRCTAMAAGYDSPRYTWTVNGVPAKESTFPVTSLSIVVPVVATFPRPTSKTIEERDAKMRFESDDNILTLYGDGADGNYDIKVEVTAHESATALNPVPPSSASTTISMSGQIVTFEQRYYDDVDACVDRFRDLNDKFAKSESWPGFDPRRNPLHKLDMIQRMSVDLADRDPVAAGRLATVAANYAQKVRR